MAEIGDNTQGAVASAAVDAYYARRRSVGFRSLLVLVPVAVVLAALRAPILGFDLMLGAACGLGNMWLVMRNNERLLAGRRSPGVYGLVNVIRILGIGVVPVFSAVTGPWWSMGIALAGFFTPLVLYAMAMRQEYSTG
jgi:multisubunit Na+/H+ antiporter MnhB subunit